ncbi:MAG: DUF1501 domain-containing protein [Planctomycetales bacterium]|nr:DUF1501 domain-containing protein [Planctomycetales bacterium]
MNSRRNFHKQMACLVGGTLTSCNLIPACFASDPKSSSHRIITILLNGGNDGLNTVIPARDPLYQHYRHDLRINADDAIHLDRQMFLHPAMRQLSSVWEAGRLNIRQGVGYPNHSRSHFQSIAVWSEGHLDAQSPSFDGWLARSLDPIQQTTDAPLACSIESVDTPELLRGRFTRTTTLPDVTDREATDLVELLTSQSNRRDDDLGRVVTGACRDAEVALRRNVESTSLDDEFPKTRFGTKMRQIASVIDSMPEIKAIHAQQSGYDTHASQRLQHSRLLGELADGLNALDRFLDRQGLSEPTLVMVFSEFGRRVMENASGGTDHGAGAPMFLIGGPFDGGLVGQNPDLENLDDGDVSVTDDFRDVYRRVSPWLTT